MEETFMGVCQDIDNCERDTGERLDFSLSMVNLDGPHETCEEAAEYDLLLYWRSAALKYSIRKWSRLIPHFPVSSFTEKNCN